MANKITNKKRSNLWAKLKRKHIKPGQFPITSTLGVLWYDNNNHVTYVFTESGWVKINDKN